VGRVVDPYAVLLPVVMRAGCFPALPPSFPSPGRVPRPGKKKGRAEFHAQAITRHQEDTMYDLTVLARVEQQRIAREAAHPARYLLADLEHARRTARREARQAARAHAEGRRWWKPWGRTRPAAA
jgi:Spy/CpxP family protein refolding chaperone